MSKRKKYLITSVLLSVGLVAVNLIVENQYRFFAIGGLSLLTLLLFAWSLKEGMGFDMTILTLIVPTLFTLGVGIFWFLLPSTFFAKIPIIIFYGFGVYALCLTTNIYTVAAVRTIALLRAARGVGFVFTLVTSFLIYDAILSLRGPLYINALAVAALSFPLYLQGLWSVNLVTTFNREIFLLSLFFSLLMGEISLLLYFWPVTVVVGSLFLTIAVYMFLGLGQAKLESRLFTQTVREYLVVGLLVFLGMYIATHWGG